MAERELLFSEQKIKCNDNLTSLQYNNYMIKLLASQPK
jgi:hypothetical protein